jgi:hypothetical protein
MNSTKNRVELRCCGMVKSSGTRRVTLFTDPVISHEYGKDRKVFTTSGTYRWSFNKRIQNERNCLNYEYVFNNDNLLNYYGHFHTEEAYYVIDRDVTQQLHRSPLPLSQKKTRTKQTKTNKQTNKKLISNFKHTYSYSVKDVSIGF